MNLKAEYMINRLFIAAVILSLLPAATAFGQELRKEKLIGTNPGNPGSNYAVFYSYGMSESAVWPLGMKLLVKNADGTNGSTIRHTHDKGNGENIPVNDKVPFRFIIAPVDGPDGEVSWAAAMGIDASANRNLGQDGTVITSGCASYKTRRVSQWLALAYAAGDDADVVVQGRDRCYLFQRTVKRKPVLDRHGEYGG